MQLRFLISETPANLKGSLIAPILGKKFGKVSSKAAPVTHFKRNAGLW